MKKGMASQHGTSENEGKAWGHGEFANMPSEVMMQAYPKPMYTTDGHIDDTMIRLDSDKAQAKHKFKKNMDKGMY